MEVGWEGGFKANRMPRWVHQLDPCMRELPSEERFAERNERLFARCTMMKVHCCGRCLHHNKCIADRKLQTKNRLIGNRMGRIKVAAAGVSELIKDIG